MFFAVDGRQPRLVGHGQFIAHNATVIGSVQLHSNASVWFESTLRGDNDEITIGENSNIQDGSVLHTDPGIPLTVGKNCTIGHRVTLHGCTIGNGCLIGIGSVILNRAVIGQQSIVGAGSLIPEGKVFPDGVLLLGSPAKVVRELTSQERALIQASAEHYVQNAQRYQQSLMPVEWAQLSASREMTNDYAGASHA